VHTFQGIVYFVTRGKQ